jgi:hypothetical protein
MIVKRSLVLSLQLLPLLLLFS